MRQGVNENLKKYIPWFRKLWQSIRIKLDESETSTIFRDYIMSLINLHAPSNKNTGFGALIQELLKKENILLELGKITYAPNPFIKENWRTYAKKEENTIPMDDKPTSPLKL